jgi:hypothetical protein
MLVKNFDQIIEKILNEMSKCEKMVAFKCERVIAPKCEKRIEIKLKEEIASKFDKKIASNCKHSQMAKWRTKR